MKYGERRALLMPWLILAMVGAGISGYLTYQHQTEGHVVCGLVQGCDVVSQSSYASLRGIPTAAYGLTMYLLLALMWALRPVVPPEVRPFYRFGALGVTLGGVGVSAFLTYVELYVLHAICIWCVASATVVTLMLALGVVDLRLSGGLRS